MSSQDVRLPSNKADAPIYTIPARTIAALEHPLTILDVDKGIKTLGHHPSFQSVSRLLSVSYTIRQEDLVTAASPMSSELGHRGDTSFGLMCYTEKVEDIPQPCSQHCHSASFKLRTS
jgi:hypothetical protein